MAPAQQQANKRARISDDVVIIPDTPAKPTTDTTTPSQVARAILKAAVAPYPDAIQDIALTSSKAYNSLQNKIRGEIKKLARFDNDDEIPGSAKVNFTLTAPPDIMDLDEFKSQKEKVADATKAFERIAKEAILQVAKLRLKHNQPAAATQLEKTTHDICTLLLVENNPNELEPPVNKFAWYTHGKLDAKAYEYAYTTRDRVRMEFKKKIDDETGKTADSVLVFENGERDRFELLHIRACHILKSIFTDSWKALLEQHDAIDLDRCLTKKAKELKLEKASEDTQMVIDTEQPVSASRITELVQEAVLKDTKDLKNEIAKLRETVKRSKNSNRGASLPSNKKEKGAPLKTQKKAQKPKPNEKGKGRPAPATSPAAKGKDSRKGNNKSNKQSGQKKPKPKGRKSQTQQNQH
jgi:hypothetical protein